MGDDSNSNSIRQSHISGKENKTWEQPLKAKGKYKGKMLKWYISWMGRGANVTLCIHDANLSGWRVHWHRGDWKRSILYLGGAHLQSFGRVLAILGAALHGIRDVHSVSTSYDKILVYFQIISIPSLHNAAEWSFWKTNWVTAPHLPYILTFCLTPGIKNNKGVICPQGPADQASVQCPPCHRGPPFTSLNTCSFCCYCCHVLIHLGLCSST